MEACDIISELCARHMAKALKKLEKIFKKLLKKVLTSRIKCGILIRLATKKARAIEP